MPLKRRYFFSIFLATFFFCFFPHSRTLAQSDRLSEEVPAIVSNDIIEIGQKSGLPTSNLLEIVVRLVKLFSQALGVLLFLQFFYAGLIWMFAGGDDEKVGQAKKILWQSVLGVALMLTSYNIALFILGAFDKALTPVSSHLI